MNVFEDLIGELKDANLLEETVIDVSRKSARAKGESADFAIERNDMPVIETAANETDFYRKRAMDEVSSLQMVEHVISGIEREYMKTVPTAHDDLQAKKALHRFLQVSGDPAAAEYAAAEYDLMKQTEIWYSALAARDSKSSVANLRRFCENSRPVLSSQALMALARFYRNSPYSESVRGKFEFVMTRLFSRDIGDEKRRLLFPRDEMLVHIKSLYANWSSISLFSPGEHEQEILHTVGRFEEKILEAGRAVTFDQLIQDDFFSRIRLIKESANEMFFVPEVVAAAMDCNVHVGNKFVDLIHADRKRSSIDAVVAKYGSEYDQAISQAAGKTLNLIELFGEHDAADRVSPVPQAQFTVTPPYASAEERSWKPAAGRRWDLFSVNKWLLAATVIIVALSLGVYLWANNYTADQKGINAARQVDLTGSKLGQYVRVAKATKQGFYAVTLPVWDSVPDDEKKQVLGEALKLAGTMEIEQVQFMNAKGRINGYASKNEIEIVANP